MPLRGIADFKRSPIEMKFCCSQFEARWRERNVRGASIYICPPSKGSNGPSFVLLSRGVDKGSEAALAQTWKGIELVINISSEIRIHYCPWCGRELKKYYEESYQSLIDPNILAELKEESANKAVQRTSATPPSLT